MRILMVGLDKSGKTTIVLKINSEDTSAISPTHGFNIETNNYQKYTLNTWDVAMHGASFCNKFTGIDCMPGSLTKKSVKILTIAGTRVTGRIYLLRKGRLQADDSVK